MKKRINYLDFIKTNHFYSTKHNVKRIKRKTTYWEKIFAKDISDKGLSYRAYNKVLKLNDMDTDSNRHLIKEDIQMTNKHMKRSSTSCIIGEVQIKTAMKYLYTSIKIAESQNSKHWQGCGVVGTLIHCWWKCKMVHLLWKTVCFFQH